MTYSTHRGYPDGGDNGGNPLSYDSLEQPWHQWAKIANAFILQLEDRMDREDLRHNIIIRLAEVAEKYRQMGNTLTKGGCYKVAQYTRLQFYDQKKRWRRVSSISLNSTVKDEDGNETELVNTLIARDEAIDLDGWLDFKTLYFNSPEKVKQAILKRVSRGGNGKLSGYDWKMIRQFKEQYKALA
jgi:hypothetical protein